jgi:hypothetical protein
MACRRAAAPGNEVQGKQMNPAMNPALIRASFNQNRLPSWTCPTCEQGVLTLDDPNMLVVRPNAETKTSGGEDWWDYDYAGYVFSGMLSCKACGESVTVVGKGHVDQEYIDDGRDYEYVTYLTPTYFTPPLKIISPKVNEQVPAQVLKLLSKAHEVCWADPDSALNRLRAIVEEILDYKGVPRTSGRSRLSLHRRIQLFNDAGTEQVRNALLAIKYVGNDGSHGFSGVKRKELLEVFSIVSYCLEKLFPIPIDDSHVIAAVSRFNANEGLQPRSRTAD